MMLLNLSYQLLDHPYAEEPSSAGEHWAKIRLEIIDKNRQIIKVVFDWQWDIKVFLTWFIENEHAITNEIIPIKISNNSIAKSIADFYEELGDDETPLEETKDGILDTLYGYITRHGIWFALRGTDIDDAYIGLVDNNITISLYQENEQWCYEIQITDFFNDIHDLYNKIDN